MERFNWTLAERLFGHQYVQEMRLLFGERSTEWVKRLPSVVAALDTDVSHLTGKKPSDAIKAKALRAQPSSVVSGRPLCLKEQKVSSRVGVRYLYQPNELEGGRRWATDPVVPRCIPVGCSVCNGPLRQYFSLYWAVSQREGEREKG